MAELDKKTRYRIVRRMEDGRATAAKVAAKFGITEREVNTIVREHVAKRERSTLLENDMRAAAVDSEFAALMRGRSF